MNLVLKISGWEYSITESLRRLRAHGIAFTVCEEYVGGAQWVSSREILADWIESAKYGAEMADCTVYIYVRERDAELAIITAAASATIISREQRRQEIGV